MSNGGEGELERVVSLGVAIGHLPAETVDAMFAGLSWEADKTSDLSVRAAVVATFAAARVEAEMMSDEEISPKMRLQAAKQFKEGFVSASKLVGEAMTSRTRRRSPVSAEAASTVPEALASLYEGDDG